MNSKKLVKKWLNKINKRFIKAEHRYYNLVSFHEHQADAYWQRFFADYNKNFNDIINIYQSIIKDTLWLLDKKPHCMEARKACAQAHYRLGILYVEYGKYDEALFHLNTAQSEIELYKMKKELRYEYVDICLRQGKCYLEKRANREMIEKCYQRAEKTLLQNGKIENFQIMQDMDTQGIADFLRPLYWEKENYYCDKNLVYKSPVALAIDTNLAWATCYIDIHDRLYIESNDKEKSQMEKEETLKQAKRYLSIVEKLWGVFNPETSSDIIEIKGLSEYTTVKVQLRKNTNKEYNKILETYLTTRGLYHLKTYQNQPDESYQKEPGELISALKCFLTVFMHSLNNTIAMDNIAFICVKYECVITDNACEFTKILKKLKISMIYDMEEYLCNKITLAASMKLSESIRTCLSKVDKGKNHDSISLKAVIDDDFMAQLINCIKGIAVELYNETNITNKFEAIYSDKKYSINEYKHEFDKAKNYLSTKLSQISELNKIGETFCSKLYCQLQGKVPRDKKLLPSFIFQNTVAVVKSTKKHIKLAYLSAFHTLLQQSDQMSESPQSTNKSIDENKSRPYELFENLLNFEHLSNREEGKSFSAEIMTFLDEVLKVESTNMYALNLKLYLDLKISSPNYHHANEGEKDVFRIYRSLRQSTLKKRLQKLDDVFYGQDDSQCYLPELKIYLIKLYNCISEFIDSTIVKFDKNAAPLRLGHYTKMKVLPKLVNKENSAKLRLSNMPYLNDPTEGQIMIEMLDKKWREDQGASDAVDITKKVLASYNSNSLRPNHVYIGCFTSNLDTLSMWQRYGQDGKGICLVVDAENTFDQNQAVDLSYLYIEDNVSELVSMDGKYALHKVIYYPDAENGIKILEESIADLKRACSQLNELLQNSLEKKDFNETLFQNLKCNAIECHNKTKSLLYKEFERIEQQSLGKEVWDKFCETKNKYETMSKELSDKLKAADFGKAKIFIKEGENKDKELLNYLKNMSNLAIMINNASDTLKEISLILNKMKSSSPSSQGWKRYNEFEDQVVSIISLILDQARYLIKNSYYKDEEEYRIIKYSSKPYCEDANGIIPMLYINMNKALKYKEIYIGPKVKDYETAGAYILNIDRNQGDGTIKQDIVVRKSAIPFQ